MALKFNTKLFVAGLANFVDNNCWFLFGTRLKSDLPDLKPFTDAAKKGKWIILTSDDERDAEKKPGKENKFDRKKIKLVTATASGPGNPGAEGSKLEPDVASLDSDDDGFSRRDSDSEGVTETSCWGVFPTSLGVDTYGDDAKSVDNCRRRFVLKKQSKNK